MIDFRFIALAQTKSDDLIEIARFRTRDCAQLFTEAAQEKFGLAVEIDDVYAPRTLTDLLSEPE